MKAVKRLAKETIIYGLTTVVARLLNFILTPIQTNALAGEEAAFGSIGKLMAWAAFFNIIFTYGMETAYFRFATNAKNPKLVGQTLATTLLSSTSVFTILLFILSPQLANLVIEDASYVRLFITLVALDTLAVIPLANLRLSNRPKRYMLVKLLNVAITVGMNLFFFLPGALKQPDLFGNFFTFEPDKASYYVFISFIAGSVMQLALLAPYYFKTGLKWSKEVFQKAWTYSWPLIILGMAGMVNEVLDRVVIEHWLSGSDEFKQDQLGIYHASYKIAMVIGLAVQAFRMGAEPFFFKGGKENASRQLFADVMKYFTIFTLFAFLGVVLYIDVFSLLVEKGYRTALYIVPFVCLAGVFLGIFYNLNIWYKLTDQTKFGMVITIIGAIVTVGLNYWLLPNPKVGILGAAIATLAAYIVMTTVSYFLGKKYFPVPYEIGKILFYIIAAVAIAAFFWIVPGEYLGFTPGWKRALFNTLGLLIFAGIIFVFEKKAILQLLGRK